MARRISTPPRRLSHHWYLAEWAKTLGKTQTDAVRELDWNKSTASHLWNGKQRYNQDLIDEVSAWLQIHPFELLMSPQDAMAIRQFRSYGVRVAAINMPMADPEPAQVAQLKTGT